MNHELGELEKKMGTDFQNKNLLLQALTHRSYLNENPAWSYEHLSLIHI